MSRHLNAKENKISKYLLIAGNPERIKWAAEFFLNNIEIVSNNRYALIYSGYYKNMFVSFATHGMGMPSAAIYTTELIKDYDVEVIIRIGTAGSYNDKIHIFDILNPIKTFTESNIGKEMNYKNNKIEPNKELFDLINETSKDLNIKIKNTNIHTTDVFYQNFDIMKKIAKKENLSSVEMESFIVWLIAKKFNKKAASILMVSDNLFPKNNEIKETTFQERIKNTKNCWLLGLETLLKINKK